MASDTVSDAAALANELHAFCAAAPHDYPGHNIELFERVESFLRTLIPVAVSRDKLADKISAKIAQLKHYRDNEYQLDHAKTIAEGRISQANQILHWIAEDSSSLPAVAVSRRSDVAAAGYPDAVGKVQQP